MQTLSAGSMMSKRPIPLIIADPNFADVVLLLEFEGSDTDTTTIDESPLNQTVTFVGNAEIDSAQIKVGNTSFSTDNTPEGDYITVPTTDMTIGTEDFTIEFYFRTYDIQTGTNNGVMYDQRTNETSQVRPVLYFNGFGGLFWFVNGVNDMEAPSSSIANNTWYHVAISRTGTTTRMFLDGTQEDSFTDTHDYLSNGVRIGSDTIASQGHRGWIDHLRVTIGTGRYTANFTPTTIEYPTLGPPVITDPNFSNVILLLPLDGTDGDTFTTDLSNDARTATFVNSAQIDSAQAKFGNTSLVIADSTDDDVNFPNSIDFVPDVDYTMEAHVRINVDDPSNANTILGYRTTGSQHGWDFFIDPTNDYLRFLGWGSGNSTPRIDITGTTATVLNTWYHVAAVRSGSGDWEIFLDGISEGTGTEIAGITNTNNPLYIGRDITNTTRYLDGWIDNVRITRGVARYTANFTPPTEAYPTS